MKESVIIVCAGRVLARNLAAIEEKYQIAAVADNKKRGKLVDGYQCIGIEEIKLYCYDKIIICSVQYEQVIRVQLSSEGIADSKIYSIGSLDRQLYYDKDRQKYSRDKKDYIEACRRKQVHQFLYHEKDEYPILSDYRETAGNIDGHYFLMDILIAREVTKRRPTKHFDIGSRIDGFISHLLAAGIDTTVIDIRSLCDINAGEGIQLHFIQADATNLDNIPDHSIESLSALHSIEHFGLGRYGDGIDPEAHLKVVHAMTRVLALGASCIIQI